MGIFDNKPGGIFGGDPDKDKKKGSGDFADVSADSSTTGRMGGPSADFSDVSAGASSTADTTQDKTYTVKSGDSLSKIAKKMYGDANDWHRIYEANRDKIKDPDLIHPGQEFTIPGA